MSQPTHQQTQAQASPPQSTGVLQRKCKTCGQHTLAREICENCREGRSRNTIGSLSDALLGVGQAAAVSAVSHGTDLSHIPVSGVTSPVIQAKLTVGRPGDKYEQEADRVAEEVVQRIHNPKPEPLQCQPLPEDDNEQLHRKPTVQKPISSLDSVSTGDSLTVSPNLETAIHNAQGKGNILPEQVRRPMEQAFGADFGGVKVHSGAESDWLNHSLSARAFTTGQDIFFRQGAYNPGNQDGKALIAHELVHVVQQNKHLSFSKARADNSLSPQQTFHSLADRLFSKTNSIQRVPGDSCEEPIDGKVIFNLSEGAIGGGHTFIRQGTLICFTNFSDQATYTVDFVPNDLVEPPLILSPIYVMPGTTGPGECMPAAPVTGARPGSIVVNRGGPGRRVEDITVCP